MLFCKVVVNAANGIVYVQEDTHSPSDPGFNSTATVHHSFGTHAGPWLFAEVFAGVHCMAQECLARSCSEHLGNQYSTALPVKLLLMYAWM